MNTSANESEKLNYFLIRKYLWSSTFYLHRYGSIIWIVLGLTLNLLAFVTWTRPRLRRHNTSANYLAGIAMSDFLFWILYIIYYLQMSWDMSVRDMPVWCELFQGVFLSIQYFSVPLVLVFSIERYIAVCHPFQRERLCTHKRALINTIICGIVVSILGFLQMISLTYNYETGKCEPKESVHYNKYWNIFQTGVEILISALLPFATLIVNILVIIELKSITSKTTLIKPLHISNAASEGSNNQLLVETNSSKTFEKQQAIQQQNKEKSAFRSSTILLLSVSFLLIITTLPVGLVYALQFLCPNGDESLTISQMRDDATWKQFINYQIVKELVDFFAMVHFVINFVIYYVTGDSFRSEFHILFGCPVSPNGYDEPSLTNSHNVGTSKVDGHRRVNRTDLVRKKLPHATLSEA